MYLCVSSSCTVVVASHISPDSTIDLVSYVVFGILVPIGDAFRLSLFLGQASFFVTLDASDVDQRSFLLTLLGNGKIRARK